MNAKVLTRHSPDALQKAPKQAKPGQIHRTSSKSEILGSDKKKDTIYSTNRTEKFTKQDHIHKMTLRKTLDRQRELRAVLREGWRNRILVHADAVNSTTLQSGTPWLAAENADVRIAIPACDRRIVVESSSSAATCTSTQGLRQAMHAHAHHHHHQQQQQQEGEAFLRMAGSEKRTRARTNVKLEPPD
ncbi:hypothetical protein AXG93_3235s1120 [Marchantia polymorpha subsp. ruderalis]|uniref:Uncharacterized protein n=1 Tax=Marchantia polymorpha subsp. ruderalis TaxID=1480154 RepID=A0A176WMM5_MARPO|nr:hypothetical protein AXG93_3235s1120 [Marchantia polymorpha subsp. ruderalis]